MRDILFRAKRIDNGEWVEGYYMNRVNHEIIQDGAWIIWEVDENTVCQYTGLTDKNGNKIWENDILRYSYDYENSPWLEAKGLTNKDIKYYIGAVFWQEWRGVWAVCGKGTSRGCNQDVYVYSRNPNRVEVIGNIFDNEDLLKGE